MAMSSYFCKNCNRTVQDDNSHCCSFRGNNEFFSNLRQLDEELDTNYDETTAIYAAMFDDKNRNTLETAQQFGNSTQASTSVVRSDSFIENKEMDGGSFRVSIEYADRPLAQDASFHSFESIRVLDTGADEPFETGKVGSTVPGTSTIHYQTIGSDRGEPYVCDQCTFRCKYKSKFDRHYRKHTGEMPFRCNICGKNFAQKSTLDSHLNTHTGEWPYPCEKCRRGFSRRRHLEEHLRRHTGERPFQCQICGISFTYPINLEEHIATPCRGPYSCRQCGQTFSCNEDRNRHIMQEHP